MTIQSYPNLAENLFRVCPDGSLYSSIVDCVLSYHRNSAMLGDARARDDPRITQFEENTQGSIENYQKKWKKQILV